MKDGDKLIQLYKGILFWQQTEQDIMLYNRYYWMAWVEVHKN